MREIKVNQDELLKAVRENREKHVQEYNEAIAGYKQAAKEAIQKAMERLQRRVDELDEGEMLVLSAVTFNLAVPENHAKDYDQVIKMLEMSVDSVLSIRSDEFAMYVMDDWSWKVDFDNVTRVYKNK